MTPEPTKPKGKPGRKPTGRKVLFNSVQFSDQVIEMIDEIRKRSNAKSRPAAIIPLIEKEYKKVKKD